MRWDRRRAIEKQAGACLRERSGAHGWFVVALKVLPVSGLRGDAEEGERGQLGLTPPDLIQCRRKAEASVCARSVCRRSKLSSMASPSIVSRRFQAAYSS